MHIVPSLFDFDDGVIGGAERYAYELARAMSDVTPTRLIAFGKQRKENSIGNLYVTVLPADFFVKGNPHNPFSLAWLPYLAQTDVIHCHQQHVLISSLIALSARIMGKRVFVTDLGGGGWDLSAYFSTDSWYHGHLHISQYSKNYAGHQNWPQAQVIYGGVDIKKFKPKPQKENDPYALFVGRLLPHKGVHDLIEAIDNDMKLIIVGQGLDSNYLAVLRKMAAGKKIEFCLNVRDEELIVLYQDALCIVLPSVFENRYGATPVPELLGQTLLEGMACGIPAISSNAASLPEVVIDGETYYVVDGAQYKPVVVENGEIWYEVIKAN